MTTLAEPEWDADTRSLALGHAHAPTCPVCGGPPHLCQDPALQDSWDVPKPVRCHRTTALMERQAGFTEESNPHLQALAWQTRIRPEAVT